ncbi:amino acid adenylation domain-containing protein [Clostridium kluyveri]|nr:amino acid adenylation domain-containing protein [Clostridium kluyveri]
MYGERNMKTIVNIMGVLKAGAAYVPVDPKYPEDRKRYILENSNCRTILKSSFYEDKNLSIYPETVPKIKYNPQDTAYIIYTSGSTGRPKGVVISQSAVVNTIIDINKKFDVGEKDRIIGLSSLCFDLSVYDIFGALSSGASLVQINDVRDVKNVMDVVKEKGITIWNSVPAIMDILLENMNLNSIEDYKYNNVLRLVMLSGDWIGLNLPEKIKENFPEARVISLGGATEASIWSIYYPIKDIKDSWRSIPYGMPLANQKFYVLNYEMEFCPSGVPGELYIGGRGLARGYMADKEKTENAFIEHPKLGSLYRTGDYGVLNSEGYIEFLGRKDHQVKIRGHRIELGEIENALIKHENIKNAVVVDSKDNKGRKFLCAYIVSEVRLKRSELKEYIEGKLPEYMVPKYFVDIKEIPLTANGKVDRKNLPQPEVELEDNYVAPRNEVEKKLVDVWSEILNCNNIGIEDNFLALGGDSLTAIKMYARLNGEFEITINDIFQNQTISKLSQRIKSKNNNLKFSIEKYKKQYLQRKGMFCDLEQKLEKEYKDYRRKNREYYCEIDLSKVKVYESILITGSTGYVGSHLLYEFLKNTNSIIYTIIRGSSRDKVKEKLKNKIIFYFGYEFYEKYNSRIIPFNGDLTEEYLGLNKDTYDELGRKIHCIINCAANVAHFGVYDELYKTNVKIVEKIIEFAQNSIKKDIFHVSTTSVGTGKLNGYSNVLYTEYDLDIGHEIDNFYSKTKFEAEKLMVQARKEGINTTILRLGNVVFNSQSGMFQENIEKSAFYNLINTLVKLEAIPEFPFGFLEFSYVDYVCKAMFLLITRKELQNEIYHIKNSKKITFNEFSNYLQKIGIEINRYEYEKFLDYLYYNYKNENLKDHIDSLLVHTYLMPWSVETFFVDASEKTEMLLGKMGFKWKKPDAKLIKRMIDYGIKVGFFDIKLAVNN